VEGSIEKPKIQLVGLDGNAYAILGRARSVAREAGWPDEKVREVTKEATSSDYDHLSSVILEHFDAR